MIKNKRKSKEGKCNIFGRTLHSLKKLDEKLYKELILTKDNISKQITSQDDSEQMEEYFIIINKSLKDAEPSSCLPLLILLNIILPKVPATLVQSKFKKISRELANILESNKISNQTTKTVANCLACLLKNQALNAWNEIATQSAFKMLLTLSIHSVPKIRKCAQTEITEIVSEFDNQSSEAHPCISTLLTTFEEIIQNYGEDSIECIHFINLILSILKKFPEDMIEELSNKIIEIALKQTNNIIYSYNMIKTIFETNTCDLMLVIRVSDSLFTLLPNQDIEQIKAWISAQQATLIALYNLNSKKALEKLLKYFKALTKFWSVENDNLNKEISDNLLLLVEKCIGPYCMEDSNPELLKKFYEIIEVFMSDDYPYLWNYSVQVLTALFKISKKEDFEHAAKMIKVIAQRHRLTDNLLHEALTEALKSFGARLFISCIKSGNAQENPGQVFNKPWLLPLLEDALDNSELGFFIESILPVITSLKDEIEKSVGNNRERLSERYLALWNLLPSFCRSPVDLVSSFKNVAPVIGEGLESSPILRTILLRALNHLCKAATHNKESKAVLGSYSKNFLPILFNLYCEAESEEVYAAILAYVTLSGKELCSEYLTTLIEALQSEEATSTGAQLDLCRALLPYASSKFLPTLLEIIESMLSSPQEDICLKALLVLQEYCQCSTKIMAKFFQSNIETLHRLLEVVPEVSIESIQAQQLYCLTVFVRSLKECTTLEELIMKVLPHIKSPSKEVREAAYNLLVELGRSSMRWGNQQSGLTDYLTLIQRGLDADPHTTSLTLLALTRLGFDFSTQLPPDFLSSLVVRVSQHIPSASQEIHMACLSFLKLLLTTFPRDTLEPHLKILARKLCASIKHKSRPLKHAIKTLLLQVIKKFGQEQVYKMLGKQEQREVFKKLTKTGKDEKASMDVSEASPTKQKENVPTPGREKRKPKELPNDLPPAKKQKLNKESRKEEKQKKKTLLKKKAKI